MWPFTRHPSTSEVADLRDQLIVAQTQATLLRDLVEHPPQPRRTREPRKDAKSVIAAKEFMTASLREAIRPRASIRTDRGEA